jgi:hypothetical protein
MRPVALFSHDRYDYGFFKRAGWNEVYPYLPVEQSPFSFLRKFAMDLSWKSYGLSRVILPETLCGF